MVLQHINLFSYPHRRFHDFVEGEQQRSGCSFYRQKTGPKAHEETPDAPPADEVIIHLC